MVPVEVGDVFRSAMLDLLNGRDEGEGEGSGSGSAQDRVSLVFYHDKRYLFTVTIIINQYLIV